MSAVFHQSCLVGVEDVQLRFARLVDYEFGLDLSLVLKTQQT